MRSARSRSFAYARTAAPTDDDQPIAALAKAIPNGSAAGLERAGVSCDREQSAQLAGHVFDAQVHFNSVLTFSALATSLQ